MVDGSVITALYSNIKSCVKVNELHPTSFTTGDIMSLILFALFTNDLVMEIKAMNVGVTVGEIHVPLLLYADYVAIISETETDMQAVLHVVHQW